MDHLTQAAARPPQSVRLRRFEKMGIVLWDVASGRTQRAFQIAREVSGDFTKTTFDVEAAMSVLSMLSRLVQLGFPMDEFESIVRRLGQRFSVSRSANQLLLTAAQRRTDVEQWLADALGETSKVAQTGVDLSLQAELERAVEMLLQYGDLTYNARVIELAGQLLKRHGDKIPNVDRLFDTQGVLARRFCVPSTHIAGVRRSGRSSGGLLMRG